MKTSKPISSFIAHAGLAMTLVLVSGCAVVENSKNNIGDYLLTEFGVFHEGKSQKQTDKLPYHSDNPRDYILADGTAIAIPAKEAYDLYISPYAPTKYFRSKEKPWTKIVDPYSGKVLLLGDRKDVKERDIP
jgi:hypothetical protein